MVVLQRVSDGPCQCSTAVKDVHKIANDEKAVPREWVNKDGTYVTDEFMNEPKYFQTQQMAWALQKGNPGYHHSDCLSKISIAYWFQRLRL